MGEKAAGYFCQGGTLIASFRCHCGNLVRLGTNLQAERIIVHIAKLLLVIIDYLTELVKY